MPALNFQPRFAELVAAGQKRQTIRARRKDGRDPKPGDMLYLYSGMRTKKCRRLAVAKCTEVEPIRLVRRKTYSAVRDWKREEDLARADGFRSWSEMLGWFEHVHGLPFVGLVIRW